MLVITITSLEKNKIYIQIWPLAPPQYFCLEKNYICSLYTKIRG